MENSTGAGTNHHHPSCGFCGRAAVAISYAGIPAGFCTCNTCYRDLAGAHGYRCSVCNYTVHGDARCSPLPAVIPPHATAGAGGVDPHGAGQVQHQTQPPPPAYAQPHGGPVQQQPPPMPTYVQPHGGQVQHQQPPAVAVAYAQPHGGQQVQYPLPASSYMQPPPPPYAQPHGGGHVQYHQSPATAAPYMQLNLHGGQVHYQDAAPAATGSRRRRLKEKMDAAVHVGINRLVQKIIGPDGKRKDGNEEDGDNGEEEEEEEEEEDDE